jgi:acylphosphatase
VASAAKLICFPLNQPDGEVFVVVDGENCKGGILSWLGSHGCQNSPIKGISGLADKKLG